MPNGFGDWTGVYQLLRLLVVGVNVRQLEIGHGGRSLLAQELDRLLRHLIT